VSTLQKIADTISLIITKDGIDRSTKKSLEEVLSFIQEENEKERLREAKLKVTAEESAIRKSIRSDMVDIYNALKKQLDSIQDTSNATLTSSDKLLKDTESVAAATKDLMGKVGKITDTADKIATDTLKYRDAVLSRPTQALRS
jgi:L-fucose isomerase-like protein